MGIGLSFLTDMIAGPDRSTGRSNDATDFFMWMFSFTEGGLGRDGKRVFKKPHQPLAVAIRAAAAVSLYHTGLLPVATATASLLATLKRVNKRLVRECEEDAKREKEEE